MDDRFKSNINTTLDERHGNIISHFRKENAGHATLIEKIKSEKEAIKSSLSVEVWTAIEKLLDMLVMQNFQECKCLYTQGILDCIDLYHHLKTDYINSDYIE